MLRPGYLYGVLEDGACGIRVVCRREMKENLSQASAVVDEVRAYAADFHVTGVMCAWTLNQMFQRYGRDVAELAIARYGNNGHSVVAAAYSVPMVHQMSESRRLMRAVEQRLEREGW